MSEYISGAELIAYTNVTSLAAADATALEAKEILRGKIILDKHCFTEFTDMDETSDEYVEIQLAQKMICERIWIKDNQDAKSARLVLGKGGSEKKGSDWSYSIGENEPIINDEIANILADHRDWSKSKVGRPVTGKMALKGDPYYDTQVNSRDQNTI